MIVFDSMCIHKCGHVHIYKTNKYVYVLNDKTNDSRGCYIFYFSMIRLHFIEH